jgi:hypothetical protein
MHARFDQVDKTILGRALSLLGEVRREHEVAADAQRADTAFQPAPGCERQRERLGLLGQMTLDPCLFEVYHGSFGLHGFDDCVRKQLTLCHLDAAEARKAKRTRPPKRRLWIFSAGRPTSVLRGYELRPMSGFPPGFYGGAPAAAFGVVVIDELPEDRPALFFRLFGRGDVLERALEELTALPLDAWEREVAFEPLVAFRIQMPETDPDEEERRYLMATQDLYEQWKERMVQQGIQQGIQQGVQQGVQQGLQRGAAQVLIAVYEARFGAVPARLRAAIEAVARTDEGLSRWAEILSTRSQKEVADALLATGGARPARAPARRRSRGT